MTSIPIVSDVTELLLFLPKAIKEIPESQAKARKEILKVVAELSEAVSQALNVLNVVRGGRIILSKDNLPEFRNQLVNVFK